MTSSTAVANDADLVLTVVAGTYDFDIFLATYEATSGAGGFQFDLGQGSATVSAILWAADGYGTALLGSPAAVSATTAQQIATVATSSSAPSWFKAKGQVTFSAGGTFGIRWAQVSSSANATTLKAMSHMEMRKVA